MQTMQPAPIDFARSFRETRRKEPEYIRRASARYVQVLGQRGGSGSRGPGFPRRRGSRCPPAGGQASAGGPAGGRRELQWGARRAGGRRAALGRAGSAAAPAPQPGQQACGGRSRCASVCERVYARVCARGCRSFLLLRIGCESRVGAPPSPEPPAAPGLRERLPTGPGREVPARHLRTCGEGKGEEEEEGGTEEGAGGGNPVQQHRRRQSAPVHCASPHGSGRRAAAALSPGRSCCGLPGSLLPLRHPRSSSSSSPLLSAPAACKPTTAPRLSRPRAPGGASRRPGPLGAPAAAGQGLARSGGREEEEEEEEASAAERPTVPLNLCCRVQVPVPRTDTEPPARPAAALSCCPKWRRRPWDSPGRMGNRGRCQKTCKVRGELHGAPPPRTLGSPPLQTATASCQKSLGLPPASSAELAPSRLGGTPEPEASEPYRGRARPGALPGGADARGPLLGDTAAGRNGAGVPAPLRPKLSLSLWRRSRAV